MNTFRQAGEDINVLEYDDTQDNGLPTMMIMQEYQYYDDSKQKNLWSSHKQYRKRIL